MDLKLSETQLLCLQKLRDRVRDMFEFTAWEDDIDDDARIAVLRVRDALDDLDAFERVANVVKAASAGDNNG